MREPLPPAQPLQCSILHLAGCREDQLSYESISMKQGQFTGHMLKNFEAGSTSSYSTLFAAMQETMPDVQKPVMNKMGVELEQFNTQQAFAID